jgi:small multidrug resistance pump
MAWMLLAAAIVSEVFGTMSLRLAVGRRLWYLGVALGYLSAFSLLSLALSHGIPLGAAYGIWAAAGVALTALLSRVLFKEPFTWLMRLGVVLIIGGVLLIETGTA